jgi:hypothetical protein
MEIVKYENKYYKFIKHNEDTICYMCGLCAFYGMNCSKFNCDDGYYVEIDIKEIRKQKLRKINKA